MGDYKYRIIVTLRQTAAPLDKANFHITFEEHDGGKWIVSGLPCRDSEGYAREKSLSWEEGRLRSEGIHQLLEDLRSEPLEIDAWRIRFALAGTERFSEQLTLEDICGRIEFNANVCLIQLKSGAYVIHEHYMPEMYGTNEVVSDYLLEADYFRTHAPNDLYCLLKNRHVLTPQQAAAAVKLPAVRALF